MQGPYASGPGEETMSLLGLVRRAERLGHRSQTYWSCHSTFTSRGKKGQTQCNQIEEMSKAADVNEGGGETQNTFPLYSLGGKNVFYDLMNHVRMSALTCGPEKPDAGHVGGLKALSDVANQASK